MQTANSFQFKKNNNKREEKNLKRNILSCGKVRFCVNQP